MLPVDWRRGPAGLPGHDRTFRAHGLADVFGSLGKG